MQRRIVLDNPNSAFLHEFFKAFFGIGRIRKHKKYVGVVRAIPGDFRKLQIPASLKLRKPAVIVVPCLHARGGDFFGGIELGGEKCGEYFRRYLAVAVIDPCIFVYLSLHKFYSVCALFAYKAGSVTIFHIVY